MEGKSELKAAQGTSFLEPLHNAFSLKAPGWDSWLGVFILAALRFVS